MTSLEETGRKSEGLQDKFMHEFMIRGGKLSILERGNKYLFKWKKEGRKRKWGLAMASIISGKILCNLDNKVGDLARQIYQTMEELSGADFPHRGRMEEKLNRLGEELLPHLIGDEGFGEFKNPGDALDVVSGYFIYQTRWQISQSPRERELLNSLGEF